MPSLRVGFSCRVIKLRVSFWIFSPIRTAQHSCLSCINETRARMVLIDVLSLSTKNTNNKNAFQCGAYRPLHWPSLLHGCPPPSPHHAPHMCLFGVLVLLICVQILVHLDCFSHSLTMEVWKPARWKTAKIIETSTPMPCTPSVDRMIGTRFWKCRLTQNFVCRRQ